MHGAQKGSERKEFRGDEAGSTAGSFRSELVWLARKIHHRDSKQSRNHDQTQTNKPNTSLFVHLNFFVYPLQGCRLLNQRPGRGNKNRNALDPQPDTPTATQKRICEKLSGR